MIRTHFEVKTGKNKGFYIVIDKQDKKAFDVLQSVYGRLVREYNQGFFTRHKILESEQVWTHSHFAGHEFSRGVFNKILRKLE